MNQGQKALAEGRLDIKLPRIIFGTSSLGNLFETIDEDLKLDIVRECLKSRSSCVTFDSAGKYGAGLALETLGRCLQQLSIAPEHVLISNKLGWYRTDLVGAEPTFEPGVWKNIKHDAVQRISYSGILECFEQGNELLGRYSAQLVSVHDPDEYLRSASSQLEEQQRYNDILQAYKALEDLKQQGRVRAIGVGAKDWRVVQRIASDVPLDWVMIANSFTVKNHPQELVDFILELERKQITIINAAVFHAGFLVGSDYYDYKFVDDNSEEGKLLLRWRNTFFAICEQFGVKPAAACVQFGLSLPGITSVAMNATSVCQVRENLELPDEKIPEAFWREMKRSGLITIMPRLQNKISIL